MTSFHSSNSEEQSTMKAPANPLSAYAFFFKETQASIKSQQPDATFESVCKIVETMWQALEEGQKEKYKKQNEMDKERYLREKELYEAKTGQPVPVPKVAAAAVTATLPAQTHDAGAARCIRSGCGRPSVRNVEWEDEYCSNQCVVMHCDTVFKDWVREQKTQA